MSLFGLFPGEEKVYSFILSLLRVCLIATGLKKARAEGKKCRAKTMIFFTFLFSSGTTKKGTVGEKNSWMYSA